MPQQVERGAGIVRLHESKSRSGPDLTRSGRLSPENTRMNPKNRKNPTSTQRNRQAWRQVATWLAVSGSLVVGAGAMSGSPCTCINTGVQVIQQGPP